jgi:hypothetical protein
MDTIKIEFKRPAIWKYIEPIVPAIQALPQWYRDKPRAASNTMPYEQGHGTIKACPAMFDSMTQGYILPLWTDLYVQPTDDGEPSFYWGKGIEGNNGHELMNSFKIEMTEGMPNADKTNLPAFKIDSPWILTTPKGYSTLFMAPLNNRDIMFEAISGIIHTDVFTTYINIPFIWTGPPDFKGVIKRGIPLVQMIPFKRDTFEHEIGFMSPEDNDEQEACLQASHTAFGGGYRTRFAKVGGE